MIKRSTNLAYMHFERLVDDGKAQIVLDVLPATVAMLHYTSQEPVVMTTMPNL